MKNLLATTITAGAMAAAALGLAGQATAATGPSSVTTTITALEANDGSSGDQGSTGPNKAAPPEIGNGVQNGPYGPFGNTPPAGDD